MIWCRQTTPGASLLNMKKLLVLAVLVGLGIYAAQRLRSS